jgi:hypothetical protein
LDLETLAQAVACNSFGVFGNIRYCSIVKWLNFTHEPGWRELVAARFMPTKPYRPDRFPKPVRSTELDDFLNHAIPDGILFRWMDSITRIDIRAYRHFMPPALI